MNSENEPITNSENEQPQAPRKPGLADFEALLGYTFVTQELLDHALVHLSCSTSHTQSNERLEFLGDGILSFLVAELLYAKYPQIDEGKLTQFRSTLVSTKALAEVAHDLGLEKLISLGDSLERDKLSKRILAGSVEAVLAAIYLDGGLSPTRDFVEKFIANRTAGDPKQEVEPDNFKSLLQQLAQSFSPSLPSYKLVSSKGPDHRKQYTVCVEFAGMTFTCAQGWSKREAEQAAARVAYFELRRLLCENE
jgi:ribonuclease-3